MPDIAIVLATYNGARYVDQQIQSIREQDVSEWRLFVRDDGSTDDTPARLARMAAEDPRIVVVEPGRRLGAAGNFAALLAHAHRAGARYVFASDQDDVWRRTKMSQALELMHRLEARHGGDTPLLVHSDLRVVDESRHLIHPSFLRYQGIGHEEAQPLHVLLVQNFVTGCASLFNRALLQLALPIPECCIMHDWWLAQCAAARGAIGFVGDAPIDYRQHGGNEVGAAGVFGSLNPLTRQGRKRLWLSWGMPCRTLAQARELEARLRDRGGAPAEVLGLVHEYSSVDREPALRRLRTMRRLGIRRQRLLGTALLYVRMALLRRADGARDASR